MSDTVQRIACKAVIVQDGKVLLLREATTYADGSAPGRWHCPGGRINPGEHFLQALQREVCEETGLAVTVGQPLHVDEWFPTIQGQPNQIVAIYFVCTLQGADTVQLSDEHDASQWIGATDLNKLDLMPAEQKALRRHFDQP